MKKIISLALCVIMVLGLVACGGGSGVKLAEGQILAGFGRVELKAPDGVDLVGYGGNGTPPTKKNGMLDPVYGTCVALTDADGNTALIFTVDTLYTTQSEVNLVREAITAKTGVPGTNVVIGATHTHGSAGYNSFTNYVNEMARAAAEAIADQAPATVLAGSTQIEDMNYVRHYYTQNGVVVGDNFAAAVSADNPRVSQTTDPDKEMQLLRFVRNDETKKDILMVNWQAHGKLGTTAETEFGMANRPYISADYVGWCRMYVEKNSDLLFAYYLGAAGNLNPLGKTKEELATSPLKVQDYGSLLGEKVVAAADTLTTVPAGKVSVHQQMFPVVRTEEGVANNAATEMELTAIRVGEKIGFATVPFEVFDTNGMEIKDQSTCDTTFVLSCASMPRHEYIPSTYVWDYNTGDQVAYELTSCKHERGTAEKVAAELANMLNALAG